MLRRGGWTSRRQGDDIIVLKRLKPAIVTAQTQMPGTRVALVVDVETTGLDDAAEVVEVAMRPITYRLCDSAVLGAHEAFVGLQEPSLPLTEEIKQLIGLDDEDLRGQVIDIAALEEAVQSASILIAHSARFDRPHLERLSPAFVSKPWACSVEDACWEKEGIESAKLAYVAAFASGFFFDAHRALDDVDAVVEILRGRSQHDPDTILGNILRSARRGRYRVRVRARFEARTALKSRGYRWDPGKVSRAKNWFRDLYDEEAAQEERGFVTESIDPAAMVEIVHLDALSRFSERA